MTSRLKGRNVGCVSREVLRGRPERAKVEQQVQAWSIKIARVPTYNSLRKSSAIAETCGYGTGNIWMRKYYKLTFEGVIDAWQ